MVLWGNVWQFLKKLTVKLPYNPAIPLLVIYPRETKIHRKTCTWMSTVALFAISQSCKQLTCPSMSQWLNQLWYKDITEYQVNNKKEQTIAILNNLINPQGTVLNEKSQSWKVIDLWFQLYNIFWNDKIIEMENIWVVARPTSRWMWS